MFSSVVHQIDNLQIVIFHRALALFVSTVLPFLRTNRFVDVQTPFADRQHFAHAGPTAVIFACFFLSFFLLIRDINWFSSVYTLHGQRIAARDDGVTTTL